MDADALLLDYGVVAGGVHVQAAGQSNGTQGAVGGQGHVIGLSHGGDLFHLRKAACMAQVRLDDVHAASLQQALEVVLGEQTLAGGNGHIAGSGDLLERLHVLAQHRLLDEHGVKLLQLFGQHLGHGLVHTAVEVNGNAEVLAAALTDGGHALQNSIHFVVGVDHL